VKLSEGLELFRARSWILDLSMVTYMIIVVKACLWFMALKDPSAAQSAFVTVITGAAGAMAAVYAQARLQK
jgi:hypothetical protein